MHRTLIITMGKTPQIVTETLWALVTKQGWTPDEIVLATTEDGEEECRVRLLCEGGPFDRFYAMLGIPKAPLRFVERKRAWADVRSPDEALEFAEDLLPEIRSLTSDSTTEVHLSIAGGRKTMGIVASNLMHFFGRGAPRDTISHSLVEPKELEKYSAFWWPGCNDDPAIKAADIVLYDLPYPQLRMLLDEDMLFGNEQITYKTLVDRTNTKVNPLLWLNFATREVSLGDRSVKFDRATFASVATIIVARKLDTVTGQDSAGEAKAYTLDGSPHNFTRLWSIIRTLCDMKVLRLNADASDGAIHAEVGARAAEHAADFDWPKIDSPLSRARAQLSRVFLPRLGEKIILPGGEGKATGFKAAEIDINLPAPFSLKDLRQYALID